MWHDREVQPLRATGPLLLLDPEASYISREITLESGDLLLTYTDGLAEARDGEAMFGEERIASFLRRDPGVDPDVLVQDAHRSGPRLRVVTDQRRHRHLGDTQVLT